MIENVANCFGQFGVISQQACAVIYMVEVHTTLMAIDNNRSVAEHAFIDGAIGSLATRKQQRHLRICNYFRDFGVTYVFIDRTVRFKAVLTQEVLDGFAFPAQVVAYQCEPQRAPSFLLELSSCLKEDFVPLQWI